MNELRDFMFERVYQSPEQLRQQRRAIAIIRDLMDWHLEHPDEIPASYRQHEAPLVVQAADYIAGMTDRFALATPRPALPPDAGPVASAQRKRRSASGRTSKRDRRGADADAVGVCRQRAPHALDRHAPARYGVDPRLAPRLASRDRQEVADDLQAAHAAEDRDVEQPVGRVGVGRDREARGRGTGRC